MQQTLILQSEKRTLVPPDIWGFDFFLLKFSSSQHANIAYIAAQFFLISFVRTADCTLVHYK